MAKQSKRDAEKEQAEQHKARLAAIKAKRRKEPVLERGKPSILEKPIMLIYCEGQNTEPSYFKKFKISSMTIKAFGEGKNTLSLVKHAKKIVNKAKEMGKPFEEVWCVFDADPKGDNPKQLENFNAAVKLSDDLGYGTAYSNQAFEYWLLLHFEDHQGGSMPRTDYNAKLNEYLAPYKITYDGTGSKEISVEFFNHLFEILNKDNKEPITLTTVAIERAKKVYDHHKPHKNPGKEESSTTVFKLVERLINIQAGK